MVEQFAKAAGAFRLNTAVLVTFLFRGRSAALKTSLMLSTKTISWPCELLIHVFQIPFVELSRITVSIFARCAARSFPYAATGRTSHGCDFAGHRDLPVDGWPVKATGSQCPWSRRADGPSWEWILRNVNMNVMLTEEIVFNSELGGVDRA